MEIVKTHQRYFQQVWPLATSDADDGRVVGHLLLELLEGSPKDVAQSIRTFVNRTAMLRECGFRHIGAMLSSLLTIDARNGPDNDAAVVLLDDIVDPALVTEKQAAAIGDTIASTVYRSHMPATALEKVVMTQPVLQTMKSRYVWFVPMLETLMALKTRRSGWIKRLSSFVATTNSDVVPIESDETPNAGQADEESSFSSVVWLNADSITSTR